MLKKEKTLPGTQVKVVKNPSDGVCGVHTGTSFPLAMMAGPGSFFNGSIAVPLGAVLEVVHGPKKVDGINVVKAKLGESVGYCYWCDLRTSANHV